MGKILIIDDEHVIRLSLRELLRKDNHEVEAVSNPLEALELIKKKNWDLVVSDIVLPQLSGVELLSKIKSVDENIPVIIITGLPDINSATESLRRGAFDYLEKPIDKDKFLKVVRKALENRKLIEEKQWLESANANYRLFLEESIDQRTRELSNSEANYRDIIEKAPIMILTVDNDRKIVQVNKTTLQTLGYSQEEMLEQKIDDLIHPHFLKKTIDFVKVSFQGIDGRIESKIKTFKQRLIDVEIRTSQKRDITTEEIIGIRCFLTNITERKRLEEMKERFFIIAGHELKTPLNQLHLTSQLIEAKLIEEYGAIKPKSHKFLESLKHSIRNFSTLLQDILDMNELMGGRIHITPSQNNLIELINKAIENFKDECSIRNIIVKLNSELDNILIEIDEDAMIKVFNHLLSNAIKFSEDSKTIEIKIEMNGNNAQKNVSISFIDEGIGIDEEHFEEIFTPFTELENPLHHMTSKTKKGGGSLGIGLSISKSYIEKHGGSITVYSEGKGRGSTFTISLPVESYDNKN